MSRRFVSLLAAGALSSGCLSSSTLVKLRPDGSGTVEQTTLVNTQALASLSGLMGQMGGGEPGGAPSDLPSPKDMLDEAKLKDAATKLGTGVRFVSATPLKEGAFEGARAVFAFDDVNALTVDQSPGGRSPNRREQVSFRLQRQPGGTSLLTVTMPEPVPDSKAERQAEGAGKAPGQVPLEALALVRPFLEGLRVAVEVEVQGTMVKTSADHVSGSRVTLLDVDFGPLLADPKAFEKLGSLGPGASIDDVTPLLKGVPGIRINRSPVTVEFR